MVTSPSPSMTCGEAYADNGKTLAVKSESSFLNCSWGPIALPQSPLFGTDGIRGRAGDLLNASLAMQVGFWGGYVLRSHASQSHPVVILGQDSRNSGNMLAIALAAGLTSAGLEVWNVGICPTPAVAHLTQALGAAGGIMISASHNPPPDNGIKFFGPGGSKLSEDWQQEIEDGIRGNLSNSGLTVAESPVWGQYHARPEFLGTYINALSQPLQSTVDLTGMRIVLDLAWGAAVGSAPQAFEALGATVTCLHPVADGDRINVDCGSTHLSALQSAVLEYGAEIGFAFDGDADRVLAVDHRGRVVDGDYILYLWGQHLQRQNRLPGNLIVTTVMANLGFEYAWTRQGGTFLRTSVGDRHVQAAMVEQGAMLGGEQSGHILCPHYSETGDGVLTALHLAALVRESGVSLGELVDQSFQTYPQLLRNVRVVDRDRRMKWKTCEPLQSVIKQAEQALENQGRVLVRASGTEPVIRVMVEAVTDDLADYWATKLVRTVEQHLGH